jgi:carbamoyltransferase
MMDANRTEDRYTLGVYQGHNSTVCLMREGEILFAISEERLSRRKNDGSFPSHSLNHIFGRLGIKKESIDTVVFNSIPIEATMVSDSSSLPGRYLEKNGLFERILGERLHLRLKDFCVKQFWRYFLKENRGLIQDYFPDKKIYYPDHHLLHAYSGLYLSDFTDDDEQCLVFTCDGEGHGLSATVSLYHDRKLERLSTIHYSTSLGHFYESITGYLGMKVMEHEYKVMGLSPYSEDAPEVQRLMGLFDGIFIFSGKDFRSTIHSSLYPWFMNRYLPGYRFDYVAAAAQQTVEKVLVKWISNYARDYGVERVALAGGVFMNVKANMKIANIPFVSKVFVMPSCSDESLAVGAAVYGSVGKGCTIKRPDNLYWGMAYSDTDIKHFVDGVDKERFSVEYAEDIEDRVAALVSSNKIVAHFSGRMEWGARALGNRSIFANGAEPSLIYELNKMVKSRDFWMPFAPVILEEDADRYIARPDWRKINASSMMCAFETTPIAREHLYCAMHPYDKTLRAQIVNPLINDRLYRILKSYKEITGMGGFLNTSFNLHGYPIVCSPEDAFDVLERSGLKHLVMGHYIIQKR